MKLRLKKFDYLLILGVIIVGLAFLLFFYRKSDYLTVTVKVTEKNVIYLTSSPPSWFVYLFKKGMRELDGLGKINAEIVDVYFYDSLIPENKELDYYSDPYQDKKSVYLTLRLKTVYNSKSREYKYKGSTIVAGESLRINFEKILVEGLVTHVEGIDDPFKYKTVYLRTKLNDYNPAYAETSGVDPIIANALSVGDKVIDSRRESVAEIVAKDETPAQKNAVDSLGNVYLRSDPQRRDVYLTVKVKSKILNDEFYYLDDIRLKTGNVVPFHFNKVNVLATIVEISDSEF